MMWDKEIQPKDHNDLSEAWVKIFRINPEFRILRLTFPQNDELRRS